MTTRASDFTGSIPHDYEHGLGPVLFEDFARILADRVAAHGPHGVVETAAGTGILTRCLRDRLPPTSPITATDLNAPMLDVAITKFAPGENIAFEVVDATALPFADAAFDAVACQFGIMFFPDMQRAFSEAFRTLRPGGHFVFNVWDSFDFNPFAKIADETVASFFDSDPPAFYKTPFGRHEIDPIKHALMRAGFAAISIEVQRRHKEVGDVARFAQGLVFGNAVVGQIREKGVKPEVVAARLGETLSRELASTGGRMPLQAIQFDACKPF